MNRPSSARILLLILLTLLCCIFLAVGSVIGLIGYSDIIDIKLGRLDTVQVVIDLIACIAWLSMIPLIFSVQDRFERANKR